MTREEFETECRGICIHCREGIHLRQRHDTGEFVHDGAIRIQSSAAQSGLQSVAFLNPDDGSHVLLALNGSTQLLTFSVRESALVFDYTLPAGAAVTFRWTP